MFRKSLRTRQMVAPSQRRGRRRLDSNWRVLISARSGSTHGSVLNVSESGILFSGKARLHRGEQVVLDISARSHQFFRCRARIVWEKREKYQTWRYGGAFMDVSCEDTKMLLESLEELRRRQDLAQKPVS